MSCASCGLQQSNKPETKPQRTDSQFPVTRPSSATTTTELLPFEWTGHRPVCSYQSTATQYSSHVSIWEHFGSLQSLDYNQQGKLSKSRSSHINGKNEMLHEVGCSPGLHHCIICCSLLFVEFLIPFLPQPHSILPVMHGTDASHDQH